MNIVHLVAYSIWSGPMPSVFGLAKAQRDAGHTVSLWYDTKRDNMGGVEEVARPLIEPNFPEQPLTLSAKSTPLEWIRDCGALAQYLRAERPDVLHVHLSHDHVLAKTVTTFSDNTPILVRTIHARRSLAKRFGQSYLYRDLDGLIFRSSEHAALFEKHFGASTSMRIIPSGIDLNRFSPVSLTRKAELRSQRSIPEDATVLCHAGLIANRGQTELLEALRSLGDESVWLLYIGAGEQEATLDRLIEQSGIGARVIRAGYLEGDALVDAYRCSDLAFVGRLGNDAGGRIALEPMACGLAVLGNTEGALEALVKDDHGWPCQVLEADEITKRMREALALPREALKEKGRRALEWVKSNRSFAAEAQATVSFYEAISGA